MLADELVRAVREMDREINDQGLWGDLDDHLEWFSKYWKLVIDAAKKVEQEQ